MSTGSPPEIQLMVPARSPWPPRWTELPVQRSDTTATPRSRQNAACVSPLSRHSSTNRRHLLSRSDLSTRFRAMGHLLTPILSSRPSRRKVGWPDAYECSLRTTPPSVAV